MDSSILDAITTVFGEAKWITTERLALDLTDIVVFEVDSGKYAIKFEDVHAHTQFGLPQVALQKYVRERAEKLP